MLSYQNALIFIFFVFFVIVFFAENDLHCCDQKREVIYIKYNNAWTKEHDDKPILTKAIKVIANENIKNIYNEVKNSEKNILIVLTLILKKIIFTS
jgi:hypothetical protein